MVDKLFENRSLEKIEKDAERIQIKSKSDFISYSEFLIYFNNLKTITRHNLIIGINFTYGWMPTMFEFVKPVNIPIAVEILNKSKKRQCLGVDELQQLKECFNNSLVGSSKLLHFINPNQYPIWDSRVFRYLTNKEPHSYRLNNSNLYLRYLEFCEFITNQSGYGKTHRFVEDKIGYSMSRLRSVELIMYFNGVKRKKTI